MTISSDLPSPVSTMAVPPPPAREMSEGAERIPDNEAAEAAPPKAPLRPHEGTKVDLTA